MARVTFPDSTSYMGCVCCWFSSLLWEVFLRVLRFSSPLNNPTFLIRSGMLERLNRSPWLGRLVTTPHTIDLNTIIDLLLADLNWPGYQNSNVPPPPPPSRLTRRCSLPHQSLVQCDLLTLAAVEKPSRATTKGMPECQLLCGHQDAPLTFTRSTLACHG